MTQQEYVQYQAAVAKFLVDNDVTPGSHARLHEDHNPYFSAKNCHCCRRNIPGNREEYVFACNDRTSYKAAICSDCLHYLTYGKLDDQTMSGICVP